VKEEFYEQHGGNNRGAIINVSSIGAYFPAQKSSIYIGTKAFLKLFTEALHLELKNKGIKVQVLCPGFVDTDFHRFTTVEKKNKMAKRVQKTSPETVVDCSLRSLKKNQSICIPGVSYKAMCGLISILPRNVVCRVASGQFKDF
jgi:short-subunit dehydrogenase